MNFWSWQCHFLYIENCIYLCLNSIHGVDMKNEVVEYLRVFCCGCIINIILAPIPGFSYSEYLDSQPVLIIQASDLFSIFGLLRNRYYRLVETYSCRVCSHHVVTKYEVSIVKVFAGISFYKCQRCIAYFLDLIFLLIDNVPPSKYRKLTVWQISLTYYTTIIRLKKCLSTGKSHQC